MNFLTNCFKFKLRYNLSIIFFYIYEKCWPLFCSVTKYISGILGKLAGLARLKKQSIEQHFLRTK